MYALNAPLETGITDEAYRRLFQPVMRKAVEAFQPEAIVFQSGEPAEHLQLGHASVQGHCRCMNTIEGP